MGAVIHERVPEGGPADREADESGNARGGREPLPHLLVVLAAAQDNAAHLVAARAAGRGHDLLAIFLLIDAFDLPDVGLDSRVLQLVDGLDHQRRAKLQVVGLLVVAEALQLG